MKEFLKGIMYVSNVADIPEGEHWVVLENKNTHVPGDKRSQEHPGHGYPAHTEHAMTMMVFESKEVLEEWVTKREGKVFDRKEYKVLFIRTPRVETKISVEVN